MKFLHAQNRGTLAKLDSSHPVLEFKALLSNQVRENIILKPITIFSLKVIMIEAHCSSSSDSTACLVDKAGDAS